MQLQDVFQKHMDELCRQQDFMAAAQVRDVKRALREDADIPVSKKEFKVVDATIRAFVQTLVKAGN